ncbi:MAG TPA: LPS assembly lipoprotein LptE, partial [Tenuifilaceae bacterium]|nr:LPS assembly lipoprotein LptE [Tenuifilaceae bacterium]
NRFITQTSLSMVDDFGDFDFSGQITQYNVSPISIQDNEVAAQNRLTISVRVKFVNAKDPKLSFDKTFSQYENFDSNQNFVQVEAELVRLIVEKLVDDIFNAAAANW